MIFVWGNPIIYKGEHGVIRHVYSNHYSISVNLSMLNAKPNEVSPGPIIKPTKDVLRDGYLLRVEQFRIISDSLFSHCMENPRGLNYNQNTYYFGGYSRVEVLDFVNWFNKIFTFATISLHQDDRFDVVGVSRDNFYFRPYLESGENWIRVVYKIELKYPNRFVAKFICVLLRTYFAAEQYNLKRITGELKGKDAINILNSTISSGFRKSHYFNRKVDVMQALEQLETNDYTNLDADIYSQTDIYSSILNLY